MRTYIETMSTYELATLLGNPDASQEDRDAAERELDKRAAESASNY